MYLHRDSASRRRRRGTSGSHQRIAVIEIGDYAYLVPYVETEAGDFFLKTVIPSRKATRKYLRESGEK